MSDFSVVGGRASKEAYRYNSSNPLVSPQGDLSRAYTTEEMTRIIEISESAANPGKTNASDIPVFIFFKNKDGQNAKSPTVTIPPGSNKYYARLQAFPDHPSGNYPDSPEGLANISFLHANQMMKELKAKDHPLPMTVVYQVGMNNNHTGTVAFRIASFDDPSKNEIMAINSLPGYSKWEDAAILGISAAMKANGIAPNKENTIKIKDIHQATSNMNSSCSAITAAMSCAISSEQSFAKQEGNLRNHMNNLIGLANEGALRRDHQAILTSPHPSSSLFNPEAVRNILRRCERFTNKIMTTLLHAANTPVNNPSPQPQKTLQAKNPNDFVKMLNANPHLIAGAQATLASKNLSLFHMCKKATDPDAVKGMFNNKVLMEAIRKEGNKEALIQAHAGIYNNMRQDNSRAPQTPNEFVSMLNANTHLIASAQKALASKNLSLFDMCKKATDPDAVKGMFMNLDLMDAISKEGKKEALIQAHADIYIKMWPDYNRVRQTQQVFKSALQEKGYDFTTIRGCEDAFHDIHTKMMADESFQCFRKTTISGNESLSDILDHAASGDNRSRKVCVELGWLNEDGSLNEDNAPEEVQDNYPDTNRYKL